MVAVTDEELRQLRESAEKYRMMIDQASDAILAISPENGEILEANPKTEEMTGYALPELLGMKVWDLHPSEERVEAKRLFGRVTATGNGTFRDFHFRRKDGSLAVIDVSASMVTWGSRKVIQRLCRDVTERRRLEEENTFLREYYERILDMMPIGLAVKRNVDSTPKVDFENQKLKEMFHGEEGDAAHAAWHDSRLESGAEKKVYLTEGEHTPKSVPWRTAISTNSHPAFSGVGIASGVRPRWWKISPQKRVGETTSGAQPGNRRSGKISLGESQSGNSRGWRRHYSVCQLFQPTPAGPVGPQSGESGASGVEDEDRPSPGEHKSPRKQS